MGTLAIIGISTASMPNRLFRGILASSGTFILSGSTVDLIRLPRKLEATSGTFTLSGTSTTFV